MEIVKKKIQSGYKETKVGSIPNDWEIIRLKALVDKNRKVRYGIVQPGNFDPNGRLMLRGQDYSDSKGWNSADKMFRVSEQVESKYKKARLKSNDLIITIVGAGTGHVQIIPDWLEGANITQTTARIALNDNVADAHFYLNYLNSDLGKHQTYKFIKGGAQPGLNVGDIEVFELIKPPLPKQKAIAQVLSTWDKAIENLTQLITEKQQKKKALMQQLLTGKKRFPGFDGEWKEVKIGDVFERIRETGEDIDDESEAYTISSKLGFVTQHQKFDRVIAGSSLKKYTLIRRDEFSYNKGNSKTFPYGCIFKFEQDHGLIPFVYISFRSKGEVSIDFYKHYFFFGMLERQLKKIITSGARGDGLLNVNPDSFFKLMIDLPPFDEQKKIAEVMNLATKELELHNQKLDTLKDQKKGLMQQLLTGKKRIKH